MSHWASRVRIWPGLVTGVIVGICCVLALNLPADAGEQDDGDSLPALNPAYAPLALENRPLLLARLIAAFERDLAILDAANEDRDLSDAMTLYHMRRELQACIDMWRATDSVACLDRAMILVLYAIAAAEGNLRPLVWHGQSRGRWPCFYLDSVAKETGGHNQLCDFQGAAGFLMVARLLDELDVPEASQIADFVERDIVGKWLQYNPSIGRQHLTGPDSCKYLLLVLNSGRDVREHFACICLDLHAMGCDDYPYEEWAKLLVDLYLTLRSDPSQLAPCEDRMPEQIPEDWGLTVVVGDDGVTWLSIPDFDPNSPTGVLDTSHANRTAWLAAKAYDEGLIDQTIMDGLANTLYYRIWAPEKGPLYFNNYVDGSDGPLDGLEAGRGGNLWFGWHRLAACDANIEELFLSIAYDLTNGGPNLPDGAQNKTMKEAPPCFEAWAARLLSTAPTCTFP
ncbi:MAG: hypothetical protein KBE65_01450 [Phycisphaerae bacterium]|nr:hypothetical protein [Phycisphaerae bacterium]